MQHNQEALLYSFFFQDKGMRQIRVTNIIIYVEQCLLSLSYKRINNTRNEGRIEETRTGWDTVVHFSLTETHDTVRSRRVIFLMKKTTTDLQINKKPLHQLLLKVEAIFPHTAIVSTCPRRKIATSVRAGWDIHWDRLTGALWDTSFLSVAHFK